MRAKTFPYLLLATAAWAATSSASRAGLRATIGAHHTLSAVQIWAESPVCVDMRTRGPGSKPCYQRTAPPYCRTYQYDTAMESAFWAAFDEAEDENPWILIGSYLSGARVQDEWWDWPISAIDVNELSDATEHPLWNEEDWLDPHQPNQEGHIYPPLVNVDNSDARAAFIAELIEESQYRRQRAEAHGPNVSLDILFLDNIGHRALADDEHDYQWANQMAVLSAVKQDSNSDGQLLFANVAIAPHYFAGGYTPDATTEDLTLLAQSVDGVTYEIAYHPNARRNDQEGVDAAVDTLQAHRAFLDANNGDGIPQTLVFIPSLCCCRLDNNQCSSTPGCLPKCDDPLLEPGNPCCGQTQQREIEAKLIAGVAMCIYDAGNPNANPPDPPDQIYVSLGPGAGKPDWDGWTTEWGAPTTALCEVYLDAQTGHLMMTRQFASGTLTIDVTDKIVTPPVLPTIHARWDEGGTDQPVAGEHYMVDTTVTGTPDRPDVRLLEGRSDWRIWSQDSEKLGGVGDIGVISTPVAENFTVKLLNDSDGPGARYAKSITLLPTSSGNSSNIAAAAITQAVEGDITVQAVSSTSGGVLQNLSVPALSGSLNARWTNNLSLGNVEGDINIVEATGDLVISDYYGVMNIDQSSAEIEFLNFAGTLDIDEIQASGLFILDNVSNSWITIDEMAAGTYATFGTAPGVSGIFGPNLFYLYTSVPQGATITFNGDLSAETTMQIGDIAGTVAINGGGAAEITGGNISGTLVLGSEDHEFSGSASFGLVSSGASISTLGAADLPGHLSLYQVEAGATITVGGDFTGSITCEEKESNGDVHLQGAFDGSLCAANFSGDKPLPPNVHYDPTAIGPNAEVCNTPAQICAVPAQPQEEAPAQHPFYSNKKSRFISFVPGASGQQYAIAVNLGSLNHPTVFYNGQAKDYSAIEEEIRWVNAFRDNSNNPVYVCPESASGSGSFKCAKLGCSPEYADWGAPLPGGNAVLHVTGAEIVPDSVYNVHLINESCIQGDANWAAFSPGILVPTGRWGSVNGDMAANPIDIARVVDKVKDVPSAWPKARTWLRDLNPDPRRALTAFDIALAVDSVKGNPYPIEIDEEKASCASAVLCSATNCLEDGFPDVTKCAPGQTCVAGYCRDECGRCSLPQ